MIAPSTCEAASELHWHGTRALDDYQIYTAHEYREAIYDAVLKRKVSARKLEREYMVNPAKVILMEHEETLPEPF